jgi:hypothetical protein
MPGEFDEFALDNRVIAGIRNEFVRMLAFYGLQ